MGYAASTESLRRLKSRAVIPCRAAIAPNRHRSALATARRARAMSHNRCGQKADTPETVSSEQFRRQLRREVEQWRAEGLVDADFADELARRYRFADLERDPPAVLLGAGVLLLGTGVVVAAIAWRSWSPEIRAGLLVGAFLGANLSGFYLWQQERARARRWGQALLALGSLLLGANLLQLGRAAGVEASPFQWLWVWGLGVLPMAYGLRSAALGGLAAVLFGLGYWLGVFDSLNPGRTWEWEWVFQHVPLLAIAALGPLAYRCRSRGLFALAAIAATSGLEANLLRALGPFLELSPAWGAAVAAATASLPPAVLWSYRDPTRTATFAPVARAIAAIMLGGWLFLLSFGNAWTIQFPAVGRPPTPGEWQALADAIALGGLGLVGWVRLLRAALVRRSDRDAASMRSPGLLPSGLFALALLLLGGVWAAHVSGRLPGGAAWLCSGLLAVLGAVLVRQGLANGQRRCFWGGLLALLALVLGRGVESGLALSVQAGLLLSAGVAAIAVGAGYERWRQGRATDRPLC